MESTQKTRDLSLYDFFSKLQEEYICAEIRHKIYKKPKDKKYWGEKVMTGKAIKIKDIALRNCLPSIFTSDSIKEKVYNKIVNKLGYPNFIYKDERERLEIERYDFINYYSVGSEFKTDEVGLNICTIISADYDNNKGIVKFKDGLVKECNLTELTRLL